MTVFPARRAVPSARALPPVAVPHPRAEAPGVSNRSVRHRSDWARRRRAERGARRLEAAGARALGQLDHLGPSWHVIEWPRTDVSDALLDRGQDERAGFLAIGPSGLFAVTIADHGRARVLVAGDVVQINGKRPPYVAEARRDAKRASKALSDAVGLPDPGDAGADLRRLWRHQRLRPAEGLSRWPPTASWTGCSSPAAAGSARPPPRSCPGSHSTRSTWLNGTYRPAADYRWYEEGRTAADKPANRR